MILMPLAVLPGAPLGDPGVLLTLLTAVALLGLFGKGSSKPETVDESPDDEFDDDEFGAGDDEFGDDEFGDDDGFGDDFDDDWGDEGDEENALLDLEDRVSDVENELASVSSTVNTVREENHQIGATVDEMDETIRKLLDVYEIVTHGINPFVDDVAMANVDDGFGLFDRPDEAEDAALDDDVAEADAESFFDDDFDDFDGEEADEAPEAEETTEPAESADGMSFDDLKAEFDAGAWDEADAEEEEEAAEDEADLDADAAPDDDAANEIDETAAVEADTAFTDVVDAPEDSTDSGVYLDAVPQTYAGQYLLTELAESLVATGGVAGAVEAARYYETLGWVSEPVRRALCEHVLAAEETAGEDIRRLTATDHLRSLGYLSRLAGDHADGEYLDLAVATEGSRDGIRG
jgi:archaellum component FlaD/FlaE/archaellum component FlaC